MVPGEYACRVHDLKMVGLGNNSRSIIGKCVLLMFLVAVQVTGEENCNGVNCPGELIVRYYKLLGCTPIYANPNDCCAEAYDCSHLDNPSRDKCYVNGHEYSVGETLRPEDRNPCDRNCTCTQYVNAASFECERLNDCNSTEEKGCLYRRTHGLCCGDPFCASPNDTVISKHDSTTSVPAEGKLMCQHGNQTLHIGEELSIKQPIQVWSVGMKCVCEVPPYLTCYLTRASSKED